MTIYAMLSPTGAGPLVALCSTPERTLASLTAALFLFEACVGMYFPSIGTLRSKYVTLVESAGIMTVHLSTYLSTWMTDRITDM